MGFWFCFSLTCVVELHSDLDTDKLRFWCLNLKEKCDLLTEYIKRLKLCIKWFQELETSYVFEQEKLHNRLEKAEMKCGETGMIRLSSFVAPEFLMKSLLKVIQNKYA